MRPGGQGGHGFGQEAPIHHVGRAGDLHVLARGVRRVSVERLAHLDHVGVGKVALEDRVRERAGAARCRSCRLLGCASSRGGLRLLDGRSARSRR